MKHKPHKNQLTAFALVTILAGTASAHEPQHGKWPTNNVEMHLYSGHFPPDDPFRAALLRVNSLYAVNPSNFYFTTVLGSTSRALYNGKNEVWKTGNLPSNVLARCSSVYRPAGGFIGPWIKVEADVRFNWLWPWSASMRKAELRAYGGNYVPFESVAIHEYGHAAGLAHEGDEYNVMGKSTTHLHANGDFAQGYLGEDLSDGLVSLYGLWDGNSDDVSVSPWRWVSQRTHDWCRIFDSSGRNLWSGEFHEGQPLYDVSPGQVVQVEFTFENNGRNVETSNIGYYVSSDNYVSVLDRLIGTRRITQSRDDVFTSITPVTIPSNLFPGRTYFLGAIIDYTNELAEVDENNAAGIPIRIGDGGPFGGGFGTGR